MKYEIKLHFKMGNHRNSIMILPCLLVAYYVVVTRPYMEKGYCKMLVEYEAFKSHLDTYLASRDDVCDGMQRRTDCSKIKEEFPDASDGVYRIKPADGKESFLVFCDMESDAHGWMVIQRRQDGSEDFYRTWFQYMDGFGNLTGEFWLGNEKIHRLTSEGSYILRIEMTDTKNTSSYAEYKQFKLADMSSFYNLTVGEYSGNAGDKMSYHNGMRFTTTNLDLDENPGNCAKSYKGAWWYKSCHLSNLNGLYSSQSNIGVWWDERKTKAVMKIRSGH